MTEGWPGIAAVGAYAPRGRLATDEIEDAWGTLEASGIEAVAVPAADEDALTMAAAAARRALAAGRRSGSDLAFLGFASTTPPVAEEELTARLGSMLGVPGETTRHEFGTSTRAGTRALRVALETGRTPALVVAADAPRGQPGEGFGQAAGAGAAAVLLDADAPGRILDAGEYGDPRPGTRFRRTGEEHIRGLGITDYDRDAFRETLAGAVDRLGSDPEPDAAPIQAPDGALPYRAADDLGVSTDEVQAGTTVHELGDTGAASVSLGIARAIADGHDRLLALGYGSGGGADALVIDADGVAVEMGGGFDVTTDLSYPEALRRRGEITPDPPAGGGAYVSIPSWRRSLPQRHRLVAGECPDCGELNFPPEGACAECGSLVAFESVELPGTGTVEAVTTIGQGGAPPEFAPQQARGGAFGIAIVAFDGPEGAGRRSADGRRSVSVPAQVAGEHPTPEVGDRVAGVVRRIYTQEGVTRYGTKVRPA